VVAAASEPHRCKIAATLAATKAANAKSIRIRFAIKAKSLRNRCEIALDSAKSLYNRYQIYAKSLQNRCHIDAQ
jgi:hypothetical protein